MRSSPPPAMNTNKASPITVFILRRCTAKKRSKTPSVPVTIPARKLVSRWPALTPSQKQQKPRPRGPCTTCHPTPGPRFFRATQTERSPCVKPVLSHPLDPTADHSFHHFSPLLSISSFLLFYYFLLLHVHKFKFPQVLKNVKILPTHTHRPIHPWSGISQSLPGIRMRALPVAWPRNRTQAG